MSITGQERLENARVVLFGMGGTGIACSTYLAAAGIGELVLVDECVVQPMDLTEAPLFQSEDVQQKRGRAAATKLSHLNENIRVRYVDEMLTSHNAEPLVEQAHLIVDGLSDWQEKLLLSDVCMQLGKTLVHAGLRGGFEFQVYTMIPGRSACLRCVFSRVGLEDVVSHPITDPAVLGPVAGMAGCFQAIESIKILSGLGPTPGNHLIKFDSLRRDFDDVTDLGPRPDCPDCGMRF